MQQYCQQIGFSKFLTVFNQNKDLSPSNAFEKASIILYMSLSIQCHKLRFAAIPTDVNATIIRQVQRIELHYLNVSPARQRNRVSYHNIPSLL